MQVGKDLSLLSGVTEEQIRTSIDSFISNLDNTNIYKAYDELSVEEIDSIFKSIEKLKENREKNIKHFTEEIVEKKEQQNTINGDMTAEELFDQYDLKEVKKDDLNKTLEDIKQRQNPVQERVNTLVNEKIVKE